jgi:hypothetical protein
LSASIRDPVGPTNDETKIVSVRLPVGQFPGQCLTTELPASFIEQDDLFGWIKFAKDRLPFRLHGLSRFIIFAAAYRRNYVKTKLPLAGKSPGVDTECIVYPERLAVTDGQ